MSRRSHSTATDTVLLIEGMTCNHCVTKVADALGSVDPSLIIEVDLKSGSARLPSVSDPTPWLDVVRAAGYGAAAVTGYRIEIDGMHCQACADRVTDALQDCSGVSSALVPADLTHATVVGFPDTNAMRRAVSEAGYLPQAIALSAREPTTLAAASVPTKAKTSNMTPAAIAQSHARTSGQRLAIKGMTCASCVRAIETALERVDGVEAVAVNYADESATVIATGVNVRLLINAIKQAGYDAAAESAPSSENADRPTAPSSFAKVAAPLTLGALLMAGMQTELAPRADSSAWLAVAIATAAVMAFSGGHFFRAALAALRRGSATMDTLIALGTGTAWLYSTAVVLVPDLFPVAARHLYFEAAMFVIGFVSLGRALEMRARVRTRDAIARLLEHQPETANSISADGKTRTIAIAELKHQDRIRVRPGEHIPIDAVVIEGTGNINESLLTGESDPVHKVPGDHLIGGTVNLTGAFICEVTATGKATVLSRIVARIGEAQNSKPRIGRLVDDVAAVFVPFVLLIAGITLGAWWLAGPEPKLNYMLVTATSVLIIACPCALGLATPLSLMLGLGHAARNGVLIANSEALQAAGRLTTVVLDKTGTLTKGEPEVVRFVPLTETNAALGVALALEAHAEHPVARAIESFALARPQAITELPVRDFEAVPGAGAKGLINGEYARAGQLAWLQQEGVDIAGAPANCTIFIALGDQLVAGFEVRDALRKDAHPAIAALRRRGVLVLMLTGDADANARRVANLLDIPYVAEASPGTKFETIKALQARGERVGMVGDGINDSLALSAADVGFAMGGGTGVALESADVALLRDNLLCISDAIRLSRLTMRNVKQNLTAAFAYNLLLIPVAAGVLYPIAGVLIHPGLAGAAMALSSMTVVANALRLSR